MIADARALLTVALEAAREAAAHAASGWRTRPTPEHKGRIDLVTHFDRECETMLRARLSRATPTFAFVGEESSSGASGASERTPRNARGRRARGKSHATWYVDPLDGTTNFVHGHPFWCVSVGLTAGSDAVLGAVVAPALGVEWAGVAGEAATRNGAPCRVSDVAALDDALLATGFPYDRSTSADNNFDAFVSIKKRCQAVRRCGSAAIDLCLVADGTYDGYWETKLHAWDLAAGVAIVLAAGGRVSDYAGAAADVTRGQVVATNGRVHDALVGALCGMGSLHSRSRNRHQAHDAYGPPIRSRR